LFNAVAAVKLIVDRSSAEHLKNGLISTQNLPLALAVSLVVVLAELFHKKFNKPRSYLLASFAVVLPCFVVLYLSPEHL